MNRATGPRGSAIARDEPKNCPPGSHGLTRVTPFERLAVPKQLVVHQGKSLRLSVTSYGWSKFPADCTGCDWPWQDAVAVQALSRRSQITFMKVTARRVQEIE